MRGCWISGSVEEVVEGIASGVDLAHHAVEILPELVDVGPPFGREEDAGGVGLGDPALFQVFERTISRVEGVRSSGSLLHISISVHLVENQINRFIPRHRYPVTSVHHGDLVLELRMRNIDHVQQQVGFTHLVEGRFERLDQFGRQFADETHGIRQQERQVVENHLSHRRIERGEEFVFGEHLAFEIRFIRVDLPTLV